MDRADDPPCRLIIFRDRAAFAGSTANVEDILCHFGVKRQLAAPEGTGKRADKGRAPNIADHVGNERNVRITFGVHDERGSRIDERNFFRRPRRFND